MEMRNSRSANALLGALATVLVAFAVPAGTADAAPAWYFAGEELEGAESVANGPPPTLFAIPGLTIICEPSPLEMTIWNSAGTGKGEVTEFQLPECGTTEPACEIEATEAEGFPWPANLTSVSGADYLVINGIQISFYFVGALCALNEVMVEVEGSAGGRVDNTAERIEISAATLKATKTGPKAFGQPVEMGAILTLHATEGRIWQPLTVL